MPSTDAEPLPLNRRGLLASGLAALIAPTLARAAGPGPVTCSISLEGNRVWIAAGIKASKPLLFMIDTGASFNMLRPEIAREQNLKMIVMRESRGLGRNVATGQFVMVPELVLGGTLRIPDVGFTTYDFGDNFDKDAAGLLAAGLFTAFDSDLDFERSELRIWPKGRPDRDGLSALPSHFLGDFNGRNSSKVIVQAMLDGRPYRLLCDTGAPGDVLLYPRAAAKLFAADRPYAPTLTSGIGGQAEKLSRIVRMDSLQIGPLSITHPLVTVMGSGAAEIGIDHDGLLGLGLLRAFLLSTDSRGGKLWIARNNLPLPPSTYRLSGMWIDRGKTGDVVVRDVGFGSPAALAGLRAGDMITEPGHFEEALRATGGPPGKVVRIKISRDGATQALNYTLKPWF